MNDGMSTEKFFRIIAHLKEAKSVASGMALSPDPRFNAQKLHLLGMLNRIQHLVVSLRADFIDLFYFRSPYEAGSPALSDIGEPAAGASDVPGNERRSKVVPFDRRRTRWDRRQIHTFLARDRRSGIADRRRRRPGRGTSIQLEIQEN